MGEERGNEGSKASRGTGGDLKGGLKGSLKGNFKGAEGLTLEGFYAGSCGFHAGYAALAALRVHSRKRCGSIVWRGSTGPEEARERESRVYSRGRTGTVLFVAARQSEGLCAGSAGPTPSSNPLDFM